MDQSYSESDVSLSPSQILERLQVLRQLQLLQRGKLQKQRLDYQETSENSSSVTEIVSHFSNTTSYNTFRSLLETPQDSSNDGTPRVNKENRSPQLKQRDLIDGISVLNLSQESEFIVNSPVSARSQVSAPSRNELLPVFDKNNEGKTIAKKVIFLDDMPILSPKKDFESLVLEKLQAEKAPVKSKSPSKADISTAKGKKPFLKRGQGTSRFGLQRKDFIIQNTKSLPWRQKSVESYSFSKKKKIFIEQENVDSKKVAVEILVTHPQKEVLDYSRLERDTVAQLKSPLKISDSLTSSTEKAREHPKQFVLKNLELPKGKQPLSKGKTWANVFTKEQNDFLKQLKQSDYYKNFASPSKSSVSDTSCDETLSQMRYDKEMAEQNMFDLLENKVSHESFNLENSFFNRFLKRSKLNGSGESTPIVLQKCLANNPELMHIYPNLHKKTRQISQCESEYTDCCSETCSSVSSCSCKTIEESRIETKSENSTNNAHKIKNELSKKVNLEEKEVEMPRQIEKSKNITDNDTIKANMVEMNAKLIATSELLKERLCELEDEIETFRQENSSLTKMREEIDAERQKFYEEKNVFEQKFNEEKILSEYYLAEEKEKLTKQKQLYEKYVREMRGRLNKKEKDEVINLKKEINNLKEEMRVKDAKTTSTIARLRNQIKITEKEKKDLQEEIEKLKKENRRLHHSNDMTRRMTNLKYLEEINKKLSNITVKETQSEVNLDSNAKYKAFEIERQSRPRKIQAMVNKPLRTRAKSVPNLKVTSRYAKYFSQRDIASDMEKNQTVNELTTRYACPPYNEDSENEISINDGSIDYNDNSEHEDENNLEKLYVERFGSTSARSSRSNLSNSSQQNNDFHGNPDTFFIQKPNSNKDSRSPGNAVSPLHNSSGLNSNKSKSPILDKSNSEKSPRNRYDDMQTNSAGWISNSSNISHNQSRSPISILTNRSSSNQKPETIIHKEQYRMHMNISPEPLSSKTSITKTILNPMEIKKPDGTRELRFPNGNIKFIAADGKYSKFVYYNGDVKENFYNEGRIKYFYAGTKTYHTTHADGLEVLEFPDGQVEKRYKDGSTNIRLPNGSVRYYDPKNVHIREEWRFPDGAALTVSATGEQRIVFPNGQVEVHAIDHKRREFPDGTVKLVYNDGTSETRYASGRVRIKDKHGNLIMDSATG